MQNQNSGLSPKNYKKKLFLEHFIKLFKKSGYFAQIGVSGLKNVLLNQYMAYLKKEGLKFLTVRSGLLKILKDQKISHPFLKGRTIIIYSESKACLINFIKKYKIVFFDFYGPKEVVKKDLKIKEGSLNLKIGTILQLIQKFLPVKIVKGMIHLSKDYLILKKDEVISKDKAQLLRALHLKEKQTNLDYHLIGAFEGSKGKGAYISYTEVFKDTLISEASNLELNNFKKIVQILNQRFTNSFKQGAYKNMYSLLFYLKENYKPR